MIDIDQARVLLKHLAIANKKFVKRHEAHKSLHKHLENVRKVSGSRSKKKDVENALGKLEGKINEVLEIEKQLISRQSFEMAYGNLLKKKIEDLKGVKLTKKPVKKDDTLKKQIRDLEFKFNKMKKMQNYDKEVIDRVKNRINELKKKF